MLKASSEREKPFRRLHLLLLQQGAGVWGDRELRTRQIESQAAHLGDRNPKVGFLFYVVAALQWRQS
jgi:hypothetical protein